ncbi:hypothetical protein [Kiloniella sp.]|uniref:hypothetical protein n=1 Tax=Kiloniella sp. TaxID=1938587 RepID=UPI003B025C3D
MLIVIYLLYVKLSETIHINRLLGGRHLFLLNKAEKSQLFRCSIVKRALKKSKLTIISTYRLNRC